MAIDYNKLLNWECPEIRQRYAERDTILYALAIGLGSDPLDERQLAFVYERSLRTAPTYPVVLGYPGFWLRNPATGVTWTHVVHGEQGIILHAPLPPAGEVISRTRVTDIVDKGPGKGALIYTSRDISSADTGQLLATLTITSFCRADGGFGGPTGPVRPVHRVPKSGPDLRIDLPTLPQAALLYRLCGDDNPLHADPAIARAAGFERPILHGLCSLGVAGHALLRAVNYEAGLIRSIAVRFTAPVYPGDVLTTELWRDGRELSFRTLVTARGVVVLNNGHALLRDESAEAPLAGASIPSP